MKTVAKIIAIVLALQLMVSSAIAAGPAFSGMTANADTAETVATNPAGMMRLDRPSFYANPMVIYTDSETEITAGNSGQSQTVSNDSWFAMPGIYYARPVGDRWAIGIGPNAATGLGASYGDNWAGRYLVKDWSLAFVGVAPAVAYRVNDKLSLGASVPIMYSRYNLEKAVFNLDPNASDGSFEITADGWGVGGTIGLLYEISEHTRFGLVYRSKVSVTEEGDPEFSGLTEERRALLEEFGALNRHISFDTSTPQVVTAGVYHDFQNGWDLSLDGVWVDFSDWGLENVEIGDQNVSTRPGNYQDIWGGSIGVSYELGPKWTARSGVFYVSSAIEEEDRTAFMRLDEMWGAGLGIEYKFSEHRNVAFDLTYIQFGDGEFSVQDAPVVGDIEGEYTTNYALVFGIASRW